MLHNSVEHLGSQPASIPFRLYRLEFHVLSVGDVHFGDGLWQIQEVLEIREDASKYVEHALVFGVADSTVPGMDITFDLHVDEFEVAVELVLNLLVSYPQHPAGEFGLVVYLQQLGDDRFGLNELSGPYQVQRLLVEAVRIVDK